jgi:spore germination protein GerM
MDKQRWLILGFSVIVLVALVLIFYRGQGREEIRPAAGEAPQAIPPEPEQPQETRMITLFFLSDGDSLFHAELRQIGTGPSDVQEAERVVEELLKGSEKGLISPLPPETKLRQLFITKSGVAYVDFSKELADKHPSGSSAEIATIYSIVNSLTYNFKSIKKVFILVEGGEKETLAGHISLSQAFDPRYSLSAD